MSKEARRNWTREEQILAFNLYCKTPFSKISATYNNDIKELAAIIGRSDSAVALKLVNFASLDPSLRQRNVSGMKNVSKSDQHIWDEFHGNWEELSWQSEKILAQLKGISIAASADIKDSEIPEGLEKEAVIKARVNQAFFRKSVLASYSSRCCITGISVPQLLVASHIVPWSIDRKNRLNPSNGLCLNSLHDKAFDAGLITITPDLRIKISEPLKQHDSSRENKIFSVYDNHLIHHPQKFYPSIEFLDYHNQHVFVG